MLQIEVYYTKKDGQELAGVINYDGKELTTNPVSDEYAWLLDDLIAEPTLISGYNLDPKKPKEWIQNIHLMLSTYVRCTEAKET